MKRRVLSFISLFFLFSGVVATAASVDLALVEQERVGEWVKVKARISSDVDQAIKFESSQIALKMQGGGEVKEWRFLEFFPNATADLKKDESITNQGTQLGDKLVWAGYFELQQGRSATVTVPLKAKVPIEAVLLSRSPGSKKGSQLVIGQFTSGKVR
jgi:hypothetical protein